MLLRPAGLTGYFFSGLDWSEDSAEDDDVEAERVPPYHNAWRLQEGHTKDVYVAFSHAHS